MKVLLISPFPPPYGGIAHWTSLVFEYAKKNGDDIQIINTAPPSRGVDGRSFFQRVFSGMTELVKHYKNMRNIVKQNDPEVVHISTSASLALVRDYVLMKYLKKKKIPCVYHLHFGRIPKMKEMQSYEWKMMKKTMRLAAAVVAMNEATYDALCGIVDEDKLYNIPNPINTSALPESMEYREHDKYVLYTGWVQKTKGVEELLGAWQQIKNEAGGWSLKLVGPVRDEYRQFLKENNLDNGVEFIGELAHDEAMEYMSKAGVFVLASYSEGFPNVILEAMAMRVPVIATEVGAIPQMLDGNGRLIQAREKEPLAQAILEMIKSEQEREACSEALYKRVMDNYDIPIVYGQYKRVWEKSSDYGK